MSGAAEASYEAVFHISENQFQLTDYGVVPELAAEFGELIVPFAVGGFAVYCGISDGPVRLRAEVATTPPPLNAAGWDEVAEISFDAPSGGVRVVPLFEDPVPDIPALTNGPGTYRARVYASGRATARNRFVDHPTEDYLIQIWPDVSGN
jgi:hypothetical protein